MKIIVTRDIEVRSEKHPVAWSLKAGPEPQTHTRECCEIAIRRKAAKKWKPETEDKKPENQETQAPLETPVTNE